ncbi:MAG: Transposase [Candidatus Midichloria mitochondrii]|nr:transposase [Candidatus Midichloria mitochondrii]
MPKLVSYNRFVELMRDAVTPLVILLNCCKGKQTGALTQQKAGRFVITYVLAVIRSLKASLAKQFLGQNLFFSGLLAYVFKPGISHGK